MKKVFATFAILLFMAILSGADTRGHEDHFTRTAPRKKCIGYTIIEFGKGLDCHGDTVKLIRLNGVQVLASQYVELSKKQPS
ncbi:MAG: hypothetical protein ACOYXT_11050 [Bacteroidota bacterium]